MWISTGKHIHLHTDSCVERCKPAARVSSSLQTKRNYPLHFIWGFFPLWHSGPNLNFRQSTRSTDTAEPHSLTIPLAVFTNKSGSDYLQHQLPFQQSRSGSRPGLLVGFHPHNRSEAHNIAGMLPSVQHITIQCYLCVHEAPDKMHLQYACLSTCSKLAPWRLNTR